VTEPVARTSVRRTVRMAVALVAGQAVLCAVIGWVTFGAGHPHRPSAAPTVEPLAVKPLVIPPPVIVPPPRPPRSSAAPSTGRKASTAVSSERSSSTPTPRPSSSRPAAARPAAGRAATPDPPALVVPSPAPDDVVQSPVTVPDVCDPVDARGLTADGVSVTCVVGRDGVLRWQLS
jgi:hypothetical protein